MVSPVHLQRSSAPWHGCHKQHRSPSTCVRLCVVRAQRLRSDETSNFRHSHVSSQIAWAHNSPARARLDASGGKVEFARQVRLSALATSLVMDPPGMESPAASPLPGRMKSSPPQTWKTRHARHIAASMGGNVMTMRSLGDLGVGSSRYGGRDTPDIVLHQGRRPGSRARASSFLGRSSTPMSPNQPPMTPAENHISASETNRGSGWPGTKHLGGETSLVMPSAKRASALFLNEESPPLSPDQYGSAKADAARLHASSPTPVSAQCFSLPLHSLSLDTTSSSDSPAPEGLSSPALNTMWSTSWLTSAISPRTDDTYRPSNRSPPASSSSWSTGSGTSRSSLSSLWSPKSHDDVGRVESDALSWWQRLWAKRSYASTILSSARADGQTQSLLSKVAPYAAKFTFLGITFVVATAVLGYCLSTLPLHLPKHLAHMTLSEVSDLCTDLQTYAHSSSTARLHVFLVLSLLFTWKQAFCVPGSLIMNIVFGAVYGSYLGALFASILTGLGGMFCYLLAMPFDDVVASLPKISGPLVAMRKALMISDTTSGTDAATSPRSQRLGRDLWTYLFFLRLLPVVPYGMMNIACGVLHVPMLAYVVTLAVGSTPWNFCTAQIGEILHDVASAIQASAAAASSVDGTAVASATGRASILASGAMAVLLQRLGTVDMIVKLVLLSAASTLPIILHRYYGHGRHGSVEAQLEQGSSEEEE